MGSKGTRAITFLHRCWSSTDRRRRAPCEGSLSLGCRVPVEEAGTIVTTFKRKHKTRSLYYRVRGKERACFSSTDWDRPEPIGNSRYVRSSVTFVSSCRICRAAVTAQPLKGTSASAIVPTCCGHYWITCRSSLANIVGFSLGGAVALEMALQRPQGGGSAGTDQHIAVVSNRPLAQVA
jgi:hypothetical protein